MTEKDVLGYLKTICLQYDPDSRPESEITSEILQKCMMYIDCKIDNRFLDRNDKESWEQYKNILYWRLENKSPQSTFELSLGLPDGVGSIVLEEVTYGRMYIDMNYQIHLRKDNNG